MDFRFREATQKFVKDGLGMKHFDGPISIPGVCKGLAEGNAVVTEFTKFAIETAIKVHHIKKVIVVHHAECGAYGISDPNEEFQKETSDEKKGDAILSDLFPDLSFQLFFAKKGICKYIHKNLPRQRPIYKYQKLIPFFLKRNGDNCAYKPLPIFRVVSWAADHYETASPVSIASQ